ncbi:hypothetical protein N7510_007535 [Penicillium lagena]|uniref:uncharacterized protein n=1 Tax=Penicillium lagena TaxID=94218 RepID=UPI0025407521|nr:uncharacterized protein N7510_007535 [Penicillium lagena]KAJ5610816.1 hypothetical protein N7510_007535 [Penicillium lagena]
MPSITRAVYSLPELPRQRSRPLRLLCLGLPRSGTESLRNVLQALGYDGVAHGIDWWLNHPNTSMLYCELMQLKLQDRVPEPEVLRTRYFDRILADEEATTDIPAAWFAEELLQAYPDAMVVLNRRRDVQDWKNSFRASVLPMMQSWKYWLASWFNAELFWGVWLTDMGHRKFLFQGDFEKNGEAAYLGHYSNLEKILQAEKRPYLDWSVDDGWYGPPPSLAPLCSFLSLPEPDAPFPKGNIAAEFGPKLMTVDAARFNKAIKNCLILLSCLITPVAVWWNM